MVFNPRCAARTYLCASSYIPLPAGRTYMCVREQTSPAPLQPPLGGHRISFGRKMAVNSKKEI